MYVYITIKLYNYVTYIYIYIYTYITIYIYIYNYRRQYVEIIFRNAAFVFSTKYLIYALQRLQT